MRESRGRPWSVGNYLRQRINSAIPSWSPISGICVILCIAETLPRRFPLAAPFNMNCALYPAYSSTLYVPPVSHGNTPLPMAPKPDSSPHEGPLKSVEPKCGGRSVARTMELTKSHSSCEERGSNCLHSSDGTTLHARISPLRYPLQEPRPKFVEFPGFSELSVFKSGAG